MMKLRIIISAVLIILVSCSGPGRRSGNESANVPAQNNGFDPLTLSDYDFKIKEYEFKITREDTSTYELSFLQEESDSLTADEGETAPGYRVQIFSSKNISRANEVYSDALESFGSQVYLEYSAPWYKVRVGNFTSRIGADEKQQEVSRMGYPDAWVVQTQVLLSPPQEIVLADSALIDSSAIDTSAINMLPDSLFQR